MAQGFRVLSPQHAVVVLEVFDAGGNVSQAARAAGLSHGAARRIVEQAGRIGPPGRRAKPAAKARVLEAVAGGVPVAVAAKAAGVRTETARNWLLGVRTSNGARIYSDGRTTRASGRYCWSVPEKVITDGRASLTMSGGRFLGLDERVFIAHQHSAGVSMTAIAKALHRSVSTISRELGLHADPATGLYGAHAANQQAAVTRQRPKDHKLDSDPVLRTAVVAMLGRKLSPEQVSGRLRIDFPDDEGMRISHETIYQALYVQAKGGFKSEVAQALRQGRLKRRPQGRVPHPRFKEPMIMISDRPAEVEDRAVPGHWEGDLIIGADGHSAIATIVERNTRFAVLVHLPDRRRDAISVGARLSRAMATFPQQLRASLTWDQGSEMAQHRAVRTATGMDVYFCDPGSPWQRGTNENTNGLLRQYFPKGTDLDNHTPADLAAVAAELNDRPRKTLGYLTPAEAMTKLIQQTGDASTT